MLHWRHVRTTPSATPTHDNEGSAILARWLAETQRAATDGRRWMAWRVYDSAEYADLWYDARNAGERVRAATLTHLYANQRQPGGAHPDPRDPGAFSPQAVAVAAARAIPVAIWQRPVPIGEIEAAAPQPIARSHPPDQGPDRAPAGLAGLAATPEGGEPRGGSRGEPADAFSLAWLVTYPEERHKQPTIMLHEASSDIPQPRIIFDLACMIGYIHRERSLLDPRAPHGITLLPRNPGLRSLLHQFAIALLCLDPVCPTAWGCHCNIIRARYNAPPPSHAQPTDTLSLSDLQRATPRLQSSK